MVDSPEPPLSKLVVVADTGPLLHLDELDALDVLNDFPEILVVPAVHHEIRQHRPELLERSPRLAFNYSAPHNQQVDALATLYTLHRGEREALALCVQHKLALFLTDDAAARLAAKALQIDAHGTIGLLTRAVRMQHRTPSEVIELLKAIPQRSTLHVRPAFLAEVIEHVRLAWGV